jgi:hypothetical protein
VPYGFTAGAIAMLSAATALALTLTVTGSGGLTSQPAPVEFAQIQTDDESAWSYLYTDTFEDGQGQEITQDWWIELDPEQIGETVRFVLLSRRSPASTNGTAAALFGYIANCEAVSYALEEVTFLDGQDEPLETQTYQSALQAADPDSQFHGTLVDICGGVYTTP